MNVLDIYNKVKSLNLDNRELNYRVYLGKLLRNDIPYKYYVEKIDEDEDIYIIVDSETNERDTFKRSELRDIIYTYPYILIDGVIVDDYYLRDVKLAERVTSPREKEFTYYRYTKIYEENLVRIKNYLQKYYDEEISSYNGVELEDSFVILCKNEKHSRQYSSPAKYDLFKFDKFGNNLLLHKPIISYSSYNLFDVEDFKVKSDNEFIVTVRDVLNPYSKCSDYYKSDWIIYLDDNNATLKVLPFKFTERYSEKSYPQPENVIVNGVEYKVEDK